MATTYLQLVNNVLVRLRENEVSSVSDTPYSSLIGVFVNDAKREVENATMWQALNQTIVVNTVAGTRNYSITGSGQRFRTHQVLNDTQDIEVVQAPANWIDRQYYLGSIQNAAPCYYNYNGVDSAGDTQVDVWPRPDGVYQLRFDLNIPQADLTSNSDIIKTPPHLIQLLAYAKAIGERGEDGGTSFNEIYQQYRLALADEIAIERNRYNEDVVWESV